MKSNPQDALMEVGLVNLEEALQLISVSATPVLTACGVMALAVASFFTVG